MARSVRPVGVLAALLLLLVVPAASSRAQATPAFRYVSVSGSDTLSGSSNDCTDPANPCGTIGHAIAVANGGDTILIAALTRQYQEQGLTIDKSLTLAGQGASASIIVGDGSNRIFDVTGSDAIEVTFSGITIEYGGGVATGAGIEIDDPNANVAGDTQRFGAEPGHRSAGHSSSANGQECSGRRHL